MKVAELAPATLARRLREGALMLQIPPFVARIRSDVPSVARDIRAMYGEFELAPDAAFADFSVEVAFERGWRRRYKPLVRFYFDDLPSFTPLPAPQAFAMIEWGLNWCVAAHAHQYLVIHAAVIEKDGHAAVLPAPPGSGKSTLCAGLVQRGWRLLSDELALYAMESDLLFGMARPISLKNASIAAIAHFSPQASMTPPVPDTTKGTVALMRPPDDSVRRVREPARPTWIVLPRYRRDAPAELLAEDKDRAFMMLAEQSFNYDIQGERGFDAVSRLVEKSQCYRFTYGRLDDAVATFDRLAAEAMTS